MSEKSGFLVILRSWDRTHKFACSSRLPGKKTGWVAFRKKLNLEFEKFQAQPAPASR